MGGAVSSGRDNNELIDNLMGGNYIRSRSVERVFRALDRADYMTPHMRDQAYKDLAWRDGPVHLSSPCIYSEVMEGLELKPGLSFLNIGSGTGYLSTLAGLILGSGGISHGIEVHPEVVEYANKKKNQFIENSPSLDEFDYCEPIFYNGNGLCLAPLQSFYDRVYCGAGCPEEYHNYFKQLIKVGGVLVMPLNESLLQVRRTAPAQWSSRTLLSVTFAALRLPSSEDAAHQIRLEELCPPRLQVLARAAIRGEVRGGVLARLPALRPAPRPPPPPRRCPRRITIPIQEDAHLDHYFEGADGLHDLEDRASGANEMNALLSLVLSMGQHRVAGALRFDPLQSLSSSEEERDDDDDDPADDEPPRPPAAAARPCRGLITFEFQNMRDNPAPSTSAATDAAPDAADTPDRTHQESNREPAELADEKTESTSANVASGSAGASASEMESEEGRGSARRAGGKRSRRAPSAGRGRASPPPSPPPPPARRARRYRSLPEDNEDSDSEGCGRAGWAADERAARLSAALRRELHRLPLPPALRTYLDYGRRYS